MLVHLTIRNVAIIEEISIDLSRDLTAFTGETGAGKSILINALILTLGGRGTADLVRTGTSEAEVSALFDIEGLDNVRERLAEAGLNVENELVMRRIISSQGRSRAFINDRPVTVSLLREVGEKLVEISGQHEHHRLLLPRFHLHLLDNFGKLTPDRERITVCFRDTQKIQKELQEKGGDALARSRRKEYLLYQIEELGRIDLEVDEEELGEKRRYLLQLEKTVQTAQEGEVLLYSGQGAVLERVGRLAGQLENGATHDETLKSAQKNLFAAEALVDEAARSLRIFASNADLDPSSLRALEKELSMLRDMKRKHSVGSIEELREAQDEYLLELRTLEAQEAELQALEKSFKESVIILRKASKELSKKRKVASKELEKAIEAELASVGMKKAQFRTEFKVLSEDGHGELVEEDRLDDMGSGSLPGAFGLDQVQFLLSSNPGEVPRALQRIASGGELSRIMLSLKQILNEEEPVPTTIFDEVDTGIGGFTATIIGEKVKRIALKRQVICITHLPQLACYAEHHFLIEKGEVEGRTRSVIKPLDHKQRTEELARMLGGKSITEQSLAHAEELLADGKSFLNDEIQKKNKSKAPRKVAVPSKTKSKSNVSQKKQVASKARKTKIKKTLGTVKEKVASKKR